ncbi:hypothetical protein [Halopseudomonas sabulinigri]|uniref:Two pore domain potassium channel family protein n=1 Tax=Halopseudomonas sabulinigri TaxID=472181 RepID=A0ABP9ZRV3_9GAMM
MTIVDILVALFGLLLILFTLFDALVTILGLQGGGPGTTFVTQKIWSVLLMLHRRKPQHRLLTVCGPALMVLVVLLWYAMLYLGWFLVFNSVSGAVVNDSTTTFASDLQTLYFTGVTISGLGYGDFTARGFPWTLYATLAVSTGTLLTSLGLSYIIAVVPVALERKQIALKLNTLAAKPNELIRQLNSKENVDYVWQYLFSIQSDGTDFSSKYGAYPVVTYFHALRVNSVFSLAYLNSADILFYIANHPDPSLRPAAPAVEALRNIISAHTDNLQHVIEGGKSGVYAETANGALPEYLESLSQNQGYSRQLYTAQRRQLMTACIYDGWWDKPGR